MTVFDPWHGAEVNRLDIATVWQELVRDISQVGKGGGSVGGYAQYLRAEGKPFALATARSLGGSYESDNDYVIQIPNAHTFLWAGDRNLALGEQVPWAENLLLVDADYIVLNADTIAGSTVLGFGHKTKTFEVTFMHDLAIDHVVSCNRVALRDIPIGKVKPDLETTMKCQKLWRK